jgi:hypothetical protein
MRQGMAQEVLSHLSDIEQKLDAMDGKLNQLLKACGASTPQTASIPPATPPKKTTQKPVPPQPTAPVVTTIPQQTVVAPAQAAATQELISELRNSPDLDKRLQELKEFTDSEGIKSKKPMLRKLLEEKLGEQSPAPSH